MSADDIVKKFKNDKLDIKILDVFIDNLKEYKELHIKASNLHIKAESLINDELKLYSEVKRKNRIIE